MFKKTMAAVFPPYYNSADLQMAIDNFLEDNRVEYVDIKFSTHEVVRILGLDEKSEKIMAYNAILIYKI